jgi:1-acyl-sn-glycerol-3-phosphate acyltransferase
MAIESHQVDRKETAIAPAPGAPQSLLRRAWGVTATVLAVLYTLPLAILAALAAMLGSVAGVTWTGHVWGKLIIRTAGVKVNLEGLENLHDVGAFVLVANHQSMFDILAVLAYFPRPVRFVAKKELLKIPIFGFALHRGNHIVIDREQGGQAIRKAVEVAKSGLCIVFFAEGRRFSDNQVHRFNPGAAWLALLTKLPCVPMAIADSAGIMPRGAKFVAPGRTMRMIVGAPIRTDALQPSDRKQLTRQLEQAVRDLLSPPARAPGSAPVQDSLATP